MSSVFSGRRKHAAAVSEDTEKAAEIDAEIKRRAAMTHDPDGNVQAVKG